MLAFLRVRGFAIIDELDVEFGDGLNVITGETGAGKSIIINALSSLITARVSSDVVRGAAEHAEVVGHCFRGGEEYILRRIIGSQGRSRAYVNEGPRQKRVRPAPMGRAYRYQRRTAHIVVKVAEKG